MVCTFRGDARQCEVLATGDVTWGEPSLAAEHAQLQHAARGIGGDLGRGERERERRIVQHADHLRGGQREVHAQLEQRRIAAATRDLEVAGERADAGSRRRYYELTGMGSALLEAEVKRMGSVMRRAARLLLGRSEG